MLLVPQRGLSVKIICYDHPALGHVQSTLRVVERLVRCGAQAAYHSYNASDFNPGVDIALTLLPATVGLWPHLAAEVEREQPDLVIYDAMAPWGRCLAQRYEIPSVCTVAKFAMTRAARARMLRENGLEPDDCNRRAIDDIERLCGLRLDLEDALGCYGDCNIVFGIEELSPPPADHGASSFHYVGPALAASGTQCDEELEQFLAAPGKLIYVSAGSILDVNDGRVGRVAESAIKAFAGYDGYRVILSLGSNIDPAAAFGLPDNCLARPQLPQLAVLERADVFITHAGASCVNEGAHFGVPMIAVPQRHDQFHVARRVAATGIGVSLAGDEVSATLLRDHVRMLTTSPAVSGACERTRRSSHAALGRLSPDVFWARAGRGSTAPGHGLRRSAVRLSERPGSVYRAPSGAHPGAA